MTLDTLINERMGELFREFRKARGFSQKDISGDLVSEAQISRFESGKSMLTADKLIYLLQAIGMDFSDFAYFVTHQQVSDIYDTQAICQRYYLNNQIQKLYDYLTDYNSIHSENRYTRLSKMIIHHYISLLDEAHVVPSKDKNNLINYLYDIEKWTEYDLFLFKYTTSMIEIKDIIFLINELIARKQNLTPISHEHHLAKQLILRCLNQLLIKKQLIAFEQLYEKLYKEIEFTDLYEQVWLDFMKVESDYLRKKITKENINSFLEQLQAFAHKDLIFEMRKQFKQLLS